MLTLEARLSPPTAGYGHSVLVEVCLRNQGEEPAAVIPLEPICGAIELVITNSDTGATERLNQAEARRHQGKGPHPAFEPPTRPLKPAAELSATYDLLAWRAPLQAGTYRVSVCYRPARLVARAGQLTIAGTSGPALVRAGWDYDRGAASDLYLYWCGGGRERHRLHQRAGGRMRPEAALSNRELAALPAPVEDLVAASGLTPWQPLRQVLARTTDGTTWVVPAGEASGRPRAVDFTGIHWPPVSSYTDRDGRLFLFCTGESGLQLGVVGPGVQAPEWQPLLDGTGLAAAALLPSGRLCVAGLGPNGLVTRQGQRVGEQVALGPPASHPLTDVVALDVQLWPDRGAGSGVRCCVAGLVQLQPGWAVPFALSLGDEGEAWGSRPWPWPSGRVAEAVLAGDRWHRLLEGETGQRMLVSEGTVPVVVEGPAALVVQDRQLGGAVRLARPMADGTLGLTPIPSVLLRLGLCCDLPPTGEVELQLHNDGETAVLVPPLEDAVVLHWRPSGSPPPPRPPVDRLVRLEAGARQTVSLPLPALSSPEATVLRATHPWADQGVSVELSPAQSSR